MGGDGFQTQKKKSWVSGQVMAERVLADAITIDGRKEWTCTRRRMCGRGGVAGVVGTTSLRVCKETQEGDSGSSSSNGEEWKSQEHEEIKRLRVQVELLSKQQGAGKSPEEPGEPSRRGSGLEEGCKNEREEETECKQQLNEQKKSLQRKLRKIEKFANIDPASRDRHKEVWKEELEEIERKWTEVLPEHQKMQSQKRQSLRDKQRNDLKTARDCEEEIANAPQRVGGGKYSTIRASEPCRKGRVTLGKRQQSWKMRSRTCRQVKREDAAVRRSCSAISDGRGKKCSLLRQAQAQVLHVHRFRFRRGLVF